MGSRRWGLSPRARRAAAGAGALLLLFAVSACASSPGGTDIGTPDDFRLLATSPIDAEPAQSVEGQLSTGLDNCLGLQEQDGRSVTVSWPTGTEWLDDRGGVRLPDGRELLMGDSLEAAGQTVPAGPDEQSICPSSHDVFMLSTIAASR